MNIFNILSYKEAIKKKITYLKANNIKRYTFEALARSCRVQKTYLSKVLNHQGNLSSDQLYRACEYLRFSEDEVDYLFFLFEYENTQIESRRKKIYEKILEYQKQNSATESHIDVKTELNKSANDLVRYYSNPYYILVHMFCTIEKYSEDTQLIGKQLKLSSKKVKEIISDLISLGMIEQVNGSMRVLQNNIHLSKDDLLYGIYRTQMRLSSIEMLNRSEKNNYSFSVIFSSSPDVRRQLQENFMSFLKSTQKLVKTNAEEEVYQMNFDLINWSEEH